MKLRNFLSYSHISCLLLTMQHTLFPVYQALWLASPWLCTCTPQGQPQTFRGELKVMFFLGFSLKSWKLTLKYLMLNVMGRFAFAEKEITSMRERGGKAKWGWARVHGLWKQLSGVYGQWKHPFRDAWIMKKICRDAQAIKHLCSPDITQLLPPAGHRGVEVSLTDQCILIQPECPKCSVMFRSQISA